MSEELIAAAKAILEAESKRGTGAFFEAVENHALTLARALLSSPRVERERKMREALRKTRNELYWCAEQLKARGLPGVPGDSVDVALAESAAALSLQVE